MGVVYNQKLNCEKLRLYAVMGMRILTDMSLFLYIEYQFCCIPLQLLGCCTIKAIERCLRLTLLPNGRWWRGWRRRRGRWGCVVHHAHLWVCVALSFGHRRADARQRADHEQQSHGRRHLQHRMLRSSQQPGCTE